MIFNNPELRKLLYKEKSLDDFDIDTEGSIFYLFFEVLLTLDGTKVTDLNIEQKITDMFNDACYISTIALIIKRPALKLGHFRALCNQTDDEAPNDARADEVLCMVYFLLKYCSDRNNSSDSLMSVIDKDLRDRSRESYEIYESFFNACISCKNRIPSGYFNQIVLSPDQFYEDEGEVDWKDLTCTYNKSIIKDIVNCWKDPSQRDIVIDDMAMEVESDYYYHREDGLPLIIYPGERREEMLDYLDSLRLSDKGAENKRKRAQSKEFEKTEKTYSLDDPRIHSYQVPFLLHDENNETIITRTAKEINEGRVNPFNVNWMEVTLYDSTFVTELLEIIHSDFILDVAQAIDDEEARHQREDGQYTDVASNYYGTGQGSANFYSYMINREKEDYDDIAAVTIAHGILKNRIRAEEYQKKLEQRKLGKGATSERNQKALEVLAGGGITVADDLVLEKHVEHKIGNVATGGIGIQIKHGVEAEASKEANKEGMEQDEGKWDAVDSSCFKFHNELVKQKVAAVVKEFYHGKTVNLAVIEAALFDHNLLQKRDSHTPFIKALIHWGIIKNMSEAALKKVANGMSQKMKKLPEGGYKGWKDRDNERALCMKIGNALGTDSPYDATRSAEN